jgi:hypothetical protein
MRPAGSDCTDACPGPEQSQRDSHILSGRDALSQRVTLREQVDGVLRRRAERGTRNSVSVFAANHQKHES